MIVLATVVAAAGVVVVVVVESVEEGAVPAVDVITAFDEDAFEVVAVTVSVTNVLSN